MPVLRRFYGDVGDFRLCPSTKKGSIEGYGNTSEYWGPFETGFSHGFRPEDYGSYGVNHWINGGHVWRGEAAWHWEKEPARYASNIPLLGDCAWYGGSPYDHQSNTSMGRATESRDWNRTNPKSWGHDMARFCMDRHARHTNLTFADGSTRKVYLPELWSLKWHRQFRPSYDVEVPWIN